MMVRLLSESLLPLSTLFRPRTDCARFRRAQARQYAGAVTANSRSGRGRLVVTARSSMRTRACC